MNVKTMPSQNNSKHFRNAYAFSQAIFTFSIWKDGFSWKCICLNINPIPNILMANIRLVSADAIFKQGSIEHISNMFSNPIAVCQKHPENRKQTRFNCSGSFHWFKCLERLNIQYAFEQLPFYFCYWNARKHLLDLHVSWRKVVSIGTAFLVNNLIALRDKPKRLTAYTAQRHS